MIKHLANKIYPVILSGGIGSRLWPLSRQKSPKQFIPLIDDKNLLQNTCARYTDHSFFEKPMVICNEDHRFQVAESLRNIGITDATILLEPCARNTAPAIALAALSVVENTPEGVMLVLPSDHYIENVDEILGKLQTDVDDYLYMFGIKPHSSETGYGYIESGQPKSSDAFYVKRFIEKPSKEKAEKYCKDNAFYWNSGMFLFKAKIYLEVLKAHCPQIYENCLKSYQHKRKDLDFTRLAHDAFSHCDNISIDYAIMEKADKVAVIPLTQTQWSDIGAWGALFELSEKDKNGNIIKGDVYQVDSENCYLHSHDRLLAAVGVTDLVIVETADAILVANRDHTQELKKLIGQLANENRQELVKHKRHYAPWGYSDHIASGGNFVVNKLYFKMGAKSSLQMHYHRDKYFTVLCGAAKIMVNETVHLLSQGMSVNIKALQKHQIFAIGHLSLQMLEICSGHYLSDDDIVRFEEETR